MYVSFPIPVNNLSFNILNMPQSFYAVGGIDVYQNGYYYGSFALGGGSPNSPFLVTFLRSIPHITGICVYQTVSVSSGFYFDDFVFTPELVTNIINSRVNGGLDQTTQNALLGADIALQASISQSGGTYSWSITPSSLVSLINGCGSSSSCTFRSTDVGTINAKLTYTLNGVSVSPSVNINSVLPTVASFTGQQPSDRLIASGGNPIAPGPCGDIYGFWRYILGCRTSDNGMFFSTTVHVPSFISDPSQSVMKYVQAISTYRKAITSGNLVCMTGRSDPSSVASGWQLDTTDPYTDPHLFTEGNDFPMQAQDYPSQNLTAVLDYEMRDSLYVDDQFEMYVIYYTTNVSAIQRPLAKVVWNWGGLVVFDQPGQFTIRYSNATPGPRQSVSTSSTVAMQNNASGNRYVACAGAPPVSTKLIDSSRVFVRFHYIDFLGRDPDGNPNDPNDPNHPTDLPGWKFWTSQISQCIFDLTCIHDRRINDGLAFFHAADFNQTDPDLANPPGSPGFIAPVYNRAFVKYCYLQYLHKDPALDPDGWGFWTNDLNSNGNYGHTIDAFISSTEYRARTDFTRVLDKF